MHRGLVSRRHPINSQEQIRAHPRTESLVAAAFRWAHRIMRKTDGVHSRQDRRLLCLILPPLLQA
jgi:hypothetical protein